MRYDYDKKIEKYANTLKNPVIANHIGIIKKDINIKFDGIQLNLKKNKEYFFIIIEGKNE